MIHAKAQFGAEASYKEITRRNNMKKLLWICLLVLFPGTAIFAQGDTTSYTRTNKRDSLPPPPKEFIVKPIVGLGTGVFTFYGDVDNGKLLPQTSRIGYELSVSQNLNSYLNFRFYVLFGKLGANERSTTRNLNFESQVRMGGINISYNFDQLLPKKRNVEPYITLGIESFEFLSKTDLFDANGNRYYYWSDGSIRSLPETDPNAANALYLIRDYKYESDIREMNLDGFGKYAERSWAYTGGLGMTFLLHKQMTMRIGTALHYTMTDYVDGVTDQSKGIRQGNAKNDMFLMTSFSFHYEFAMKNSKVNPLDTSNFNDVDFFALDLMDRDGDNVPDPKDSCQDTPKGVQVDEKGCPLDGDKDGVPDYLDNELNSAPNAFVDENGVTLSDSLIALRYRMYIDSTGEFNDKVVLPVASPGGGGFTYVRRQFTVLLDKYTSGVPKDVMDKLLTINDVKSVPLKDSVTAYTSGTFNSITDAQGHADQMKKNGFPDAKVVYKEGNKLIEVNSNKGNGDKGNGDKGNGDKGNGDKGNGDKGNGDKGNGDKGNGDKGNGDKGNGDKGNGDKGNGDKGNGDKGNGDKGNGNPDENDGIIYRVQLGAFKNKINRSAFSELPDAIELKTEDGLYKYLTGSYKNIDDAMKQKKVVGRLGFNDAFVVAYKNGKRIPIEKTTQTQGNNTPVNGNEKGVTFRVQVGVFSKEPPADVKEKFSKIKDLTSEPTGNGQTRYFSGTFSDYKSAADHKSELQKLFGVDDAFIQAYHNGQPVSIQEALDILKED
jgi:hypothetical protein